MNRAIVAIFFVGFAAGAAALLVFQKIGVRDTGDSGGGEQELVDVPAPVMPDANVAALEKEIEGLRRELAGVGGGAEPVEPTEEAEEEKKGNPLLEFMMAMGSEQAKREVEKQVAMFIGRLSLTDAQAEAFRAALMEKAESAMVAGQRMMSGEATLVDLVNSDQDNFAAFDKRVAAVLDENQLLDFAAFQEEREFSRIERKTNEDLDGLDQVGGLTQDQKDRAWEVFAEINAASKPGEVPPDLTVEQFSGFIDAEIGKRIDGLTPILSAEQLEAYEGQTEAFRNMVMTMVGAATRE